MVECFLFLSCFTPFLDQRHLLAGVDALTRLTAGQVHPAHARRSAHHFVFAHWRGHYVPFVALTLFQCMHSIGLKRGDRQVSVIYFYFFGRVWR